MSFTSAQVNAILDAQLLNTNPHNSNIGTDNGREVSDRRCEQENILPCQSGSTTPTHQPRQTSTLSSSAEKAAQTVEDGREVVPRKTLFQRIYIIRWSGVAAMVAGIMAQSLCWGLIMTYGTILAFYTRYLIPNVPEYLVALAGAVPPFCLLALALPWGRLLDAGHQRVLNVAAGLLLTGGMAALAFTGNDDFNSGKYWAILLASVPMGIGQSIYFLAAPQMAKTWHPKHKGFAMGITNSGASIGGVVWPLVFVRLVDARGFREGVGVLAGVSGLLGTFIAIFARPAPDFCRRKIGNPYDFHTWWPTKAFKSKVFLIHVASICFVYLGILTIPFFIEEWGRRRAEISVSEDIKSGYGIDMDRSRHLGVYLVVTMNGCQLPGRLLGSTMCDVFKARKVHALACFVSVAIIGTCWFTVTSFEGGLAFAVFFGLLLGVMVSLPINDVQDLLGNERTHLLGQYAGAAYTCACPFILGGAVISGSLVEYYNVFVAPGAWSMGCFMTGGSLIVLGLYVKDDTACFDWEAGNNFGGDTRVNSVHTATTDATDIEAGRLGYEPKAVQASSNSTGKPLEREVSWSCPESPI